MTKRKSDSPTPLQAASLIRRVCETFERAGLQFLIIGGQAVIRHGFVRTTQDVDFTVVAPAFDKGETVIGLLDTLGLKSAVQSPAEFVRRASLYRCTDPVTGFGVDVSFVDSEYLKQALQRAITVDTDGYPAPFLGLEDVIIHKTVAGRQQDEIDAVDLIARYPGLDSGYIERWLREFESVLEQPLVDLFRSWRSQALG